MYLTEISEEHLWHHYEAVFEHMGSEPFTNFSQDERDILVRLKFRSIESRISSSCNTTSGFQPQNELDALQEIKAVKDRLE
jgi:hypothetical protein